MPMNDWPPSMPPELEERVVHYWDAANEGGAPEAAGIDDVIVAIIHELHARDDAPAPDPAFVDRLRRDLMGQTHLPTALVSIGDAPEGDVPATGPRESVAEPAPKRSRSRLRQGAGIVAAAIVLVLVTGGVATVLRWHSETAAPAVAPSATRLPAVVLKPTATPATTPVPLVDPFKPAFPGAAAIHVISEPSPTVEVGFATRTDTWLDLESGNFVVRTYDQNGQLLSLRMRQGLKLTDYLPNRSGNSADTTDHSLLDVTEARSVDDPALTSAVPALETYRLALQQGKLQVLGTETIAGNRAIKIGTPQTTATPTPFGGGTPAPRVISSGLPSTIYLDPRTLFPVQITGGLEPTVTISYPVIETFTRDKIPPGVFNPTLPPAASKDLRQDWSLADAARYQGGYAIWSLGTSYGEFALASTEHLVFDSPRDPNNPYLDEMVLTYTYGSGEAQKRILVTSRGPLTAQEWKGELEGHHIAGSAVTVEGVSGWLTVDPYDQSSRLELPWHGGWLRIDAPDPHTAVAAVASLNQINDP